MRDRERRPLSQAFAPARPKLQIEALGTFSVTYQGREVVITGRKSRALITCLLMSESGHETRERLVGLLWSEFEEDKARTSLRQSLHEVRVALAALGFDGLNSDKGSISLDRTRVDVDLWRVLDDAVAGRANALLLDRERLMDSFLREFESVDESFRILLLTKRQSYHDRINRNLERALQECVSDYRRQIDLARAILNLDPTHEEAARALIRARVAESDIGGALRTYKALWDVLEEEYDAEPSQETQELIAQVKLGQLVAPEPTRRAPTRNSPDELRPEALGLIRIPERLQPGRTVPKLLISVSNFDSSGIKPDHRYLVQGFRRELIACLVRFREWVVRDAAFSAPAPPDTRETHEFVIEADGIENSEAVRLVLTLRDVQSNTYLWSERLSISIAKWFESQQHVVRRITTALNVHLSVERFSTVAKRPPVDLKAYDLWLLGQATILSLDPQNWDRAKDLFRQVIAAMPDFAPAYSSLAQLNNSNHIVLPGISRDSQRTSEALTYAREAARLDPIDSRSQLSLGWSHAMSKHYEQAMIFIPLAEELNDNDPWTLVSAANCYAFCGEYEKARRIAEHTLSLPLAPSPLQWAYHTAIRFMQSDYEACIEAARSAGDVNPNVPGYKASALYHLGLEKEAKAECQRFLGTVRGRWVGKEPPTDANISRWFLHMFPIRRPEDWGRLKDGLAGAGAPVEGLAHHQW